MDRRHITLLLGGAMLFAICNQPQQVLTSQASAQPAAGPSYSFRLTPGQNVGGCSQGDTALSRLHTVTVSGNTAIIKSSGGIDDVAKQTSPGIYVTEFRLGRYRLDVTADLSKSPRKLVVVEKNAGCRWEGQTP